MGGSQGEHTYSQREGMEKELGELDQAKDQELREEPLEEHKKEL